MSSSVCCAWQYRAAASAVVSSCSQMSQSKNKGVSMSPHKYCLFSACLMSLPGSPCSSRIPDRWDAQVPVMRCVSLLLSIQADLERFLCSICSLNCERTGVFPSWWESTCQKIWLSEMHFMLQSWSEYVILELAGIPINWNSSDFYRFDSCSW